MNPYHSLYVFIVATTLVILSLVAISHLWPSSRCLYTAADGSTIVFEQKVLMQPEPVVFNPWPEETKGLPSCR